jgi:hypothetical protein
VFGPGPDPPLWLRNKPSTLHGPCPVFAEQLHTRQIQELYSYAVAFNN